MRVTKESLAENIGRLESYGDLSINEEYQLQAYKMLYAIVDENSVYLNILNCLTEDEDWDSEESFLKNIEARKGD